MPDKEEAYPGDGLEIALNPSTPELNKALVKFQKKHHAAGKDGQANYGAYTTLAGALAASQPATEFGLSHTQTFNYQILPQAISATATDQWKPLPVLITTLRHESGEQIESHFPFPDLVPNRGNIMQAYGSAITYARRYALLAIYGLAGDDDDGEGSAQSQEVKKSERNWRKPSKTDKKESSGEVSFLDEGRKKRIVDSLRDKKGTDKEKVLDSFKKECNIHAVQVSPDHIQLPKHGDVLERLLSLDPYESPST